MMFGKNKKIVFCFGEPNALIVLSKINFIDFKEKTGEIHFDSGIIKNFVYENKDEAIKFWKNLLET